ncbi:hypothetical protein [Micromonospora zhanjiangensis]|uniref:Uncharacterized protein n=1 Tax=Micromonospora zhanjiangensis TaxID=1522057 RepID=A0ABV8KLN9_9ACTN
MTKPDIGRMLRYVGLTMLAIGTAGAVGGVLAILVTVIGVREHISTAVDVLVGAGMCLGIASGLLVAARHLGGVR